MIIIGAGIAGLLAAKAFSIYGPVIIERQSDLPNNHSALLRFRSNVVGEFVGIPFKKVNVYKGVLCEDGVSITNHPTIRDYNAYSLKTTGRAMERSIINLNNAKRYIAPTDLIPILSIGATVQYGVSAESAFSERNNSAEIISTIPMPALMQILNYGEVSRFEQIPIWTINIRVIGADVYQTLYIPYDHGEPYRVSITGNLMTMEFAHEPPEPGVIIHKYLDIFFTDFQGVVFDSLSVKKQEYGKIVPITERERKKFILWATDKHNVYSLGRYATWRNILLDDVIKDISVIKNFISQRSDYTRAMHYHKEQ